MAMSPLTVKIDNGLRARLAQAAAQAGVSESEMGRLCMQMQLEAASVLALTMTQFARSESRHRETLDRLTVIADFVADHTPQVDF